MRETPVADPGESFGVLDALLGVSPFVFLVGVLSGLVAALVVWPVAARLDTPRGLLERDRTTYLRGPVLVGGVGLPASVLVDFARGVPSGQVGPVLAGRLLLVGACLAAVAHRVQYRGAAPDRSRANGYAYAAFVLVWTAIVLGLYAVWT